MGPISFTLIIKAFPAPIFTKLANAQQHYVQICYTEYHPTLAMNVGIMNEIILGPSVKHGFHCGSRERMKHFQSSSTLAHPKGGAAGLRPPPPKLNLKTQIL
jgi:hypothetical protein